MRSLNSVSRRVRGSIGAKVNAARADAQRRDALATTYRAGNHTHRAPWGLPNPLRTRRGQLRADPRQPLDAGARTTHGPLWWTAAGKGNRAPSTRNRMPALPLQKDEDNRPGSQGRPSWDATFACLVSQFPVRFSRDVAPIPGFCGCRQQPLHPLHRRNRLLNRLLRLRQSDEGKGRLLFVRSVPPPARHWPCRAVVPPDQLRGSVPTAGEGPSMSW